MAKNKTNRGILGSYPLVAIVGDLTFSQEEVWVWAAIPQAQYEFLRDDDRLSLAFSLNSAIANLVQSEESSAECQIIISTQEFDSLTWAKNLHTQTQKSEPHPHFNKLLEGMYNRVTKLGFTEKIVMLGVKVGNRYDFGAVKNSLNLPLVDKFLEQIYTANVSAITEEEYNFWNKKAKKYRTSMHQKMREVTASEIAFVIRKNFYPAMPAPSVDELSIGDSFRWKEGSLSTLVEADIENNAKYLKMTQYIDGKPVEGYRATLAFSKFPEVLQYPEQEPWIHYGFMLGLPIGFYSRFTVEPSRKVRKDVGKQIKAAQDQAMNQTGAGGMMTREVAESLMLGEELQYALNKSNEPWIYVRHRLIVEAPTLDSLQEQAQALIEHYRDMDILLSWPTGDQLSLLMESLPGDKIRLKSYMQNQELSILGGGVPAGAGSTGDSIHNGPNGRKMGWMGPYLGYTLGRSQEPVFYSAHSAIAKNNPPGLVITGSPGGGKSFTAFTITYQMALQGIWTIYIDPKCDALPIGNLPGMENTNIFDLRASGSNGMLDPFGITNDPSEQVSLAFETIGLLLGGMNKITAAQNIQLSQVLKQVSQEPAPTLNKVVDRLLESNNEEAKGLGATLDLIRDLQFARLCFSNEKTKATLSPDKGLTIVTLLGLDLPSSVTPPESYSNANRLAVAVMYLLASFTRQLMLNLNKSHPKAIVIDEAWAITSTPQGAKLIFEVARMGRSLNTGLVLVSQNAGDFLGEGVTNSIATKMAFRAKQPEEVTNILAFLNLEDHEGNRELIRELGNGQCLMQDSDGRTAIMQVDSWSEEMRIAFDTNPETRKSK
jgi:hypothetical protein